MRILVSCIPYDGGRSGISVYTRETVREFMAQGHGLTLLVEPGDAPHDVDERGGRHPRTPIFLEGAAVMPRVVAAPRWTRRPLLSMLWHLVVLPFWIWRHRREFDGFFICAANRRVCAWYPIPTVATIHDLANFHIPGKYSRMRMLYLARVLPFFAKRAHRLVAVSESTKADMVRFWRCPPEKITVIYEGLPGMRDARHDGEDALGAQHDGRALQEYRGAQPSCCASRASSPAAILYISRIEHPGKNHVRLIEAYGSLPRALAEAHPLVLAGADWKDAEAVHAAAKASPHADMIRFTGFVPDGEMEGLWGAAGFYVFPSLFEGFGLSLVEAMARGIPCACSVNGSLGEIAGDAAVVFDPNDAAAIAAALRELLSEPDAARAARIRRGFARAAQFSWRKHAMGVASLLEGAR